MAQGGHDPRDQDIIASSKTRIAGNAVLAEGDRVIQYFENSTVNVVSGDQYMTVVNEIHVASGSRENKFEREKLRLEALKDGAILDIATVRLLSEYADDTIQKMKKHVQRIRINTEDLLQGDQLLLTILIKRLSRLETAYVRQISLDPSMITYVKDCLDSVKIFEAGYEITESVKKIHFADVMTILKQSKLFYVRLRCDDDVKQLFLSDWMKRSEVHMRELGLLRITRVDTLKKLFKLLSIHSITNLRLNINPGILGQQFTEIVKSRGPTTRKASMITIEDKSMTYKKIEAYLDICRHCKVNGMCLAQCDLSDRDAGMILQCCRTRDIKLSELWIWDGTMTPDVYCDVATIIGVTGCTEVAFGNCDLTKQKLRCFTATCKQNQISIYSLTIWDLKMPVEVYREIAVTLKATGSKEMMFQLCELTRSKLFEFYTGCKDNCLSLSALHIDDAKMPAVCYREMANILKSISCKTTTFKHCELTKQKLSEFYNGCKDSDLRLSNLFILDGSMLSDVYREVAAILNITGCSKVYFADCDLTKQKLRCFRTTGEENELSLSTLQIRDVKIPAECYREIAITLKSMCCRRIVFEKCELTRRKLYEFCIGCKDNHLSLSGLSICDCTMTSDAYGKIAAIISITGCSQIYLGNCNLTKQKLRSFTASGRINQIYLSSLCITDDKMPAECYPEIAIALKSIKCKEIIFRDCELTRRKLSAFYTGCKDSDLTVVTLSIWDNEMTSEAYSDVVSIISVTGCFTVCFGKCDLTKQKLDCFRTNCNELQICIPKMVIVDVKMPAGSYREMAITLKSVDCTDIQFQDCELTRQKLYEFYTGCEYHHLSIFRLTIYDSTMPPHAYYDVAAIVKTTKCSVLCLRICDLSKQKLESLGIGCKESHNLIPTLIIDWSYSTATEDDISVLCDLMTFSVKRLALYNWEIDAEKRRRLEDTIQLKNSKIKHVLFPNGRIVSKRVSGWNKIRNFFRIKRI